MPAEAPPPRDDASRRHLSAALPIGPPELPVAVMAEPASKPSVRNDAFPN